MSRLKRNLPLRYEGIFLGNHLVSSRNTHCERGSVPLRQVRFSEYDSCALKSSTRLKAVGPSHCRFIGHEELTKQPLLLVMATNSTGFFRTSRTIQRSPQFLILQVSQGLKGDSDALGCYQRCFEQLVICHTILCK